MTPAARAGNFLERNSGKIILAALALTLLLVVPLLAMKSDEQASQDPTGEIFDLMDDINERFATSYHISVYIAESRDGDILTQAALWELYQHEQELKEEDAKGNLAPEGLPAQDYLYTSYNVDLNLSYLGVYTIADAVNEALEANPYYSTTLEQATDEQVKLALHYLFNDPNTSELRESLSVKAVSEEREINGTKIDYWTSPALYLPVLADNEKLGGGTLEIAMGGGETVLDKEEFNRNVQSILRGSEENFLLWGIAIDANLEGSDEGQTAGLFIMFTVIAVVLIAGVSLKSYWAVALTGAGLGILMIWLKGLTNLVGIKGGLIIDLIVPIAMISLGVDFVLHALRRYGEEKGRGYAPGMALRAGFAGVLGALVLSMASDSIAFLANASSGIEGVIHFGIAAGIATISSFTILGVVVPLAMMRIDQLLHNSPASPSRRGRFMTILNSLGVAVLAGTGVIFLVAVSEPLGLAVIFGTIVGYLVVPFIVMYRRHSNHTPETVSDLPTASTPSEEETHGWLAPIVTCFAHHRLIVLFVIVVITAAATFFATKLEATFDVKDFFDSNSDVVISLDKLDEHVGSTSGEPGTVYIKGDLTNPEALATIEQFILSLDDNPYIARQSDGDVQVWSNVLELLEHLTSNEYARQQVEAFTGVAITDSDGNGLPDTQKQIEAAYTYMLDDEGGIPEDEDTLAYTPEQIRETLYRDSDGIEEDITILTFGIPGTREQQNIIAAWDSLIDDVTAMENNQAITSTGLTGSPFTRQAQLEATTDTLVRSLPIAAIAVLILLLIVMRSVRYTIVTIIPIGLVVAWLYGLMHLTGFSFNYVTAIIGSVSLGVGIDYSIHMTERFREEMGRSYSRMQALRYASNGTGMALLASAASSIVGFAIMGFAPMPMFSSYGILTALMIFLALASSLVVLPSLLLLVTPEKKTKETTEGSEI